MTPVLSTEPMDVLPSILAQVGQTPLIELARIGCDVAPTLLAKVESLNPGGSVKDRPALAMIADAEANGLLRPGGTIVEPTSGNTGVGLAIVAARKGYRAIFVVIDKVAKEKIDLLRAYGAEVVICPTAVPPDHPDSYYSVSERLAREIPGAYMPNQFANPANPRAHETSTGPEIWQQTRGHITHFVAGMGTGGTISGTAQYLKSQNPNIQVIGIDPYGSVYSGGSGRPYFVEGVGEDFFPPNYNRNVIDRVIAVRDADSFNMARRLAREEGILVGGSSGMAVMGAMEVAKQASENDVIVVLLPDSGRGYLSKIFNDEWMAEFGFLHHDGPSIGEILRNKRNDLPSILTIDPNATVRHAVEQMRAHGVSQLVVTATKPPLAIGEVQGVVTEDGLLRAAFADHHIAEHAVRELVEPRPLIVGVGEVAARAISRLENADALLVADGGNAVGVLTRTDLLEYYAFHHAELSEQSQQGEKMS